MAKTNSNKEQRMGIFITMPFVLAVPPIVGWFLGKWLDAHFHTAPYLKYSLLVLGLISGARECYRMIKDFGNES